MNFARRLSTLKIKVNVENGDEKISLDKQEQLPIDLPVGRCQ